MESTDQSHVEKIVKRSGSSFFWGMSRLSRKQKRAMFALYAFCRVIDDIADEVSSTKKQKLLSTEPNTLCGHAQLSIHEAQEL